MNCGEFARNLEQYLSDATGLAPTVDSAAQPPEHAARCARCGQRWRRAVASQMLLASLREPAPDSDPYFFSRIQARIAAAQQESRLRWSARFAAQLGAARRDLILAAAILAITFGSFCFDLQRTESPSIAEAVALDVPHVHWRHPNQDHGPGATDVLLSLLNR